ncbi:hypothetical protein OG618_37795 (plasmid) [Kitasatospora sp. NBC_01246]|uniref:hypothetical protein n=1 Tax=Kitasatospora sp. NBC_01246 TaxID=2903570 RepID=UPI002E30757B|nr:hypothetical protein [Kitasatospora sp. NBC_01246]
MTDYPTPAALPSGLVTAPHLAAALAARDFAAVFTAARAAGISFNRIAEACGMKPERVSLVARGEARVTALESVERIADGLRIPGVLLGLALRPWEETARTTSPEHDYEALADDPVKRRDLLRGALAAGMTGTALAALAHTRQHLDLALTGNPSPASDLDHWAATAEHYAYGYGGAAPAARLAEIVADVADLQPLLQRPQPAPIRAELCHAAGKLSGMAAVVLHDLGEAREARAWFSSAASAAAESGDRRLHAWILAREAMTPLTYGAPRAAAALAEQARHVAGTTPSASAALAAAVAARAYALTGQREQALAALADVARLANLLDVGERADTWLTLPEQKEQVHLSHAYTLLGETGQARQAQARALALTGPSSHQARTLLLLDGALCDQRDGDTAQACRQAVAALLALPSDQRTGLTRSRALDLYRAIPSQRRGEQAVRDLRELIA